MYWKKGTTITTCPVIPFYVSGSTYDFSLTLVTETDEEITGAVLTVAEDEYAGMIQAKPSTSGTYLDIMGLFNGNCALGDIDAETETEIDFRINFSELTTDGTKYIAIVLQYGDGITSPILLTWLDSLWSDSIDATYISESQFSLPGDQTSELRGNQRIKLSQGTDGTAEVTCSSRMYDTGDNVTICTVSPESVTANLVTIERGLTYSEPTYGNLCEHGHTSPTSGGAIPAVDLSDSEVGDLQDIVAINSLDGILARIEGAFIALSSSTGLEVLRKNSANDAYEFALVNMADLGDSYLSDLSAGDILYRDENDQWVNLPAGDNDQLLSMASGVPAWIDPPTVSNEGEGVEIAKAQEDTNFPFKTLDPNHFEEATSDVISIKEEIVGLLPVDGIYILPDLTETPTENPDSGFFKMYMKSGKLCVLNSTGSETVVGDQSST